MGVFEHGAILSEFVPAIVLLHLLCFQPLSLVVTTPGAIVALAIPSLLAFREGIFTGEGTIIASILVPLYFLSIVLCLPGLANPFTTLCTVVAITIAKLAVCMSAVLHRWAAHGAFKSSYPVSLLLHNLCPSLSRIQTPTPTPTPTLTPAPAPPHRPGPNLSPGERAARHARLPRHPGRAHLVGVQAPRAPQVLRQAARPAQCEAARPDRRLRVVRKRAQVHRHRVQPAAPARAAAHAYRHVRPLRGVARA